MTRAFRVLALAGLLALPGPTYAGAQSATGPGLAGPGLQVPYLAQGPLLCGGASAAMVERFWGARGVYASDYASLVSREDGGILTGDLVRALTERGHPVRVVRDRPRRVLARVRGGTPAIVLLESGEARYHYVVLVEAGPREVRIHDPMLGPGRPLSRQAFLRRWAPSGHWALLAGPPEETAGGGSAPDGGAPVAGPGDGSVGTSGGSGSGRGPTGDSLPPPLASAMEALRDGSWSRAADAARGYLAGEAPARASTAREILASARYLGGDALGALAAWNVEGRPSVDLVVVRGLRRMGHRPVAEHLGIRPRDTLTPGGLRLARRRLAQLPAVRRGRVGYRPLPDGSVEVEAALMESPPWPGLPWEVAAAGVGALVQGRTSVELGPFLPAGERWRIQGRWHGAGHGMEAVVSVPWTPARAVVTLAGGWLHEELVPTGTEDASMDRRWTRATLRRWMTAGTRLGLTVGTERAPDGGRMGRLGASALASLASDRVRLGVTADGWAGSGPGFGRVRLGGSLRVPAGDGGRAWRVVGGTTLVSEEAPGWAWAGAGTGRARAPLLRGHPLVRDGRLGEDAFGRVLLHGTLGHAWIRSLGPARVSLELFVDGARVWRPRVGDGPRGYLDPGLEVSLAGLARRVAVSLARGGDGWVLSARVGRAALPWLSAP